MALDSTKFVINRAAEKLAAAPRATDERPGWKGGLFSFGSSKVDRDPPKDDMQKYWRAFESVPLVRQPIRDFASEVTEPGYRIQANNEETAKKLEAWAKTCAIIAGDSGKDLQPLLKDIIVQREVRGTVLIEHVPDDRGNDLQFLDLINPETVSVKTLPNKSLIPGPDQDFPNATKTDDGKTAAYVQWDDDIPNPDDHDEIKFTKDEITKLTRDPDVSDIFGTSRIEAVYEAIEGLTQKMTDNNQAIKQKAWPVWLFMMGSEDFPWSEDEIDDFMSDHDAEDFDPGLKQAVSGDIDVDVISGEVAEIIEYLEFDVDYIMSSMPMPKYELGSFEENINQFVSESQENRIEKQIKEARRELEGELTPIFRKKAKLEGWETGGIKLKIAPADKKSPILNDELDMERIKTFAEAVNILTAGAPSTLLSDDEIRGLILQLPVETDLDEPPDDMDEDEQFDYILNELEENSAPALAD